MMALDYSILYLIFMSSGHVDSGNVSGRNAESTERPRTASMPKTTVTPQHMYRKFVDSKSFGEHKIAEIGIFL